MYGRSPEPTPKGVEVAIGDIAGNYVFKLAGNKEAEYVVETIAETIHVHPALSEVVQGAFRDVCDVAPEGI